MNVLVIGATGLLGRAIVRQCLFEGYGVKCLVRNFSRAKFLEVWGARLIYGDLKVADTLPPALKRISIVIDASVERSSDDNSTLEAVGWRGKVALIEASKI